MNMTLDRLMRIKPSYENAVNSCTKEGKSNFSQALERKLGECLEAIEVELAKPLPGMVKTLGVHLHASYVLLFRLLYNLNSA